MKIQEKWFCIGQSGATVDGRQIEPQMLTQAAESYNPDTYTAVLNVEHYRPFFPKSEMSGLGSVLELKAETADGVTKLYARIDPTEKTIQMMKDREKVFTSMELQKNFADTGKTYLVGLALTDSPAALGTSMLKFSLAADRDQILSSYTEMAEKMSEKKLTLWAALHAALFAKNETPQPEQPATPATETKPETPQPEQQDFTALNKQLEQAAEVVSQLVDDNKKSAEAFAKLQQEFAAFKAEIEQTPVNAQAPHLGGTVVETSEF
ncbi:phage capsid protein [Neisseria brasiliensis]|uniref:GPO family capsid scaffolding protein n=1 Tax=Neisseria TaxID=482 RepID=UPI000C2731EF|nr:MULTISPECIES: GPO family capsid scaffolding protein [Neisseria]PJO78803.1 phage capsid protein [Neisseria sp. N177_16]QGL24198.1 phage capsid protein [Neisseria brasiliensis]